MNSTSKKLLFGAIAIIVGFIISSVGTNWGLNVTGTVVFGVLIGAIIMIALGVMNEFTAFMTMAILWVTVAKVPFAEPFGGFTNPVLWLVISALGLGVAMDLSGLAQRIGFWMLGKLPPTYFGQLVGVYVVGILLSAPISSSAARLAILTPPTTGISNNMGFADQSKGSTGLAMATFVSTCIVGSMAFMTADAAHMAIFGAMPDVVKAAVPWMTWFLYFLPITVILGIVMLFIILKMYNPGSVKVDREYVKSEMKKLGPIGLKEKMTGIITVVTLILWATTIWTKFNTNNIGIGAMAALLITGCLSAEQFRTKMNWPIIVFVGFIFGVPTVLSSSGVTGWLSGQLTPMLVPLLETPILFVIALFFVALVLRLISPSFSVPGIILVTALSPSMLEIGSSPFVILMVYALVNAHWTMPHLSSTRYAVSYSLTDGKAYTHAQTRPLNFIYLGVALLLSIIMVPYWQFIGLL